MSNEKDKDYVSRAAVIKVIEDSCGDPYLKEYYPDNVIEEINQMPSADVISISPVDSACTGYWKVLKAYSPVYCCSNCGMVFGSRHKVCIGCGANMSMKSPKGG